MKHSAWLTAISYVKKNIVMKDRNDDVVMLEWLSPACLNFQRLFDWRVRADKHRIRLRWVCCGAL